MLGFHCSALAPLVTATGGCSPVAVCRAATAVAFLLAEMGSRLKILSSCRHMGLVACGIFLGQGSNPCVVRYWQMDSLPVDHKGSPQFYPDSNIYHLGGVWDTRKDEGKTWSLNI